MRSTQPQDPRATIIRNVAEDQQNLESVLKEIPSYENITIDRILELFWKCFEIREEPEFIDAIFNSLENYQEFVGWILRPKRQIERRSNSKMSEQAQRRYPYECMRIARDNCAFYQALYIKSFFDEEDEKEECFGSALGYFSEIMIPFMKYEFSQSTKICDLLTYSVSKETLMSSSEIEKDENKLHQNKSPNNQHQKRVYYVDDEQISILILFSDDLIGHIIKYIHHEGVFKFLHNLILISLQQNDLKRSKQVFERFLFSALNSSPSPSLTINIDICSEYILQILTEIYENANTEKNYRVIFFIDSMIRLQLITVYIRRILDSTLLSSRETMSTVTEIKSNVLMGSMELNEVVEEEELLECFVKSIMLMVKIYGKMNKNKKSQKDIQRQSKFLYFHDSDNNNDNQSEEEEQFTVQNKVMRQFSSQIKLVFHKLPELSQLVKRNQPRTLPFSSGQNIKMITRCKYEFFQLLYNCLLLAREYQDEFIVDTDKMNIFSIIQRYLSENRWNNIAQRMLEKIAFLLIENNKNFFRTTEMKKNNMADGFLDSVIESFTNKNYIFLNSLRFTTQGNIHTLYMIAKAIINQLKQSHQLANFIHEFQYYKKFVINDLQNYQAKTLEVKYPPDDYESPTRSNQRSQNEENCVKLQVDELLSIKQIVKKIEIINKWSTRTKKHKSTIHRRSLSYISDDHIEIANSIKTGNKKKLNPSESNLNCGDSQRSDGFQYIKKAKLLSLNFNHTNKTHKASSGAEQEIENEKAQLHFTIHKTTSIQMDEIPSSVEALHQNKKQSDLTSENGNELDVRKNFLVALEDQEELDKDIPVYIGGSGQKPTRKSSSLDYHDKQRKSK